MKKTFTLLTALCMSVAYAQVESETVYTESQPVIQEKEADLYPFELGISAGWGITAKGDDEPYVCDMGFINIEGAYYVMETVAFTIDFGFGYGGDELSADVSGASYYDYYDSEYDYSRISLSLMGGIRSVIPVMPYTSVVVGAKVGVDAQYLSLNHNFGGSYYYNGYYYDYDYEEDQVNWNVGFAYAIYGGLSFQISEQTALDITYQYRGTTAKPEAEHFWEEGCPTVEAGELGFHEIRAGLRIRF